MAMIQMKVAGVDLPNENADGAGATLGVLVAEIDVLDTCKPDAGFVSSLAFTPPLARKRARRLRRCRRIHAAPAASLAAAPARRAAACAGFAAAVAIQALPLEDTGLAAAAAVAEARSAPSTLSGDTRLPPPASLTAAAPKGSALGAFDAFGGYVAPCRRLRCRRSERKRARRPSTLSEAARRLPPASLPP